MVKRYASASVTSPPKLPLPNSSAEALAGARFGRSLLRGNVTMGWMSCTGQCGPSSPFFHFLPTYVPTLFTGLTLTGRLGTFWVMVFTSFKILLKAKSSRLVWHQLDKLKAAASNEAATSVSYPQISWKSSLSPSFSSIFSLGAESAMALRAIRTP